LLGLLLTAFLFQPGKGANAQATGNVLSHAYAYVASTAECNPSIHCNNAIDVQVIVLQVDTARFLDCDIHPDSGEGIPHSQAELQAYLDKPNNCVQMGSNQLLYQPKSASYLFVNSSAGFDYDGEPDGTLKPTGTVSSETTMLIFRASQPDTLNAIASGVFVKDGKNPKADTYRYSRVLSYDADVQYPEITEKPILK
jgi:hypothetical protein